MKLAPRRMVAAETALNLLLRERCARWERLYVETGEQRYARAAYYCDLRLAARYESDLGLGFIWDGRERP